MLSDFDLSKSGSEPGGAPAGMKQSAQNGVSYRRISRPVVMRFAYIFVPISGADGRHSIMYR